MVLDGKAREFITDAARGNIRIIAHDTDLVTEEHYADKEAAQRRCASLHQGPSAVPGSDGAGRFGVRTGPRGDGAPGRASTGCCVQSAAVPNAIAAFLLFVRNSTGKVPHVYFEWSEGNPFGHLARYILVGEGDVAPITHEVLREAEPVRSGARSATWRSGRSLHESGPAPRANRGDGRTGR